MEKAIKEKYLLLTDESREEFKLILESVKSYEPEFRSLMQMYPRLLKSITTDLLAYNQNFINDLEKHPRQIFKDHFYSYLATLETFSSSIYSTMPAIAVTLCNLVIMNKMKILRLKEFKVYVNHYS